ncbi:hypothetical protein RB195_026524 [Necator americanus]
MGVDTEFVTNSAVATGAVGTTGCKAECAVTAVTADRPESLSPEARWVSTQRFGQEKGKTGLELDPLFDRLGGRQRVLVPETDFTSSANGLGPVVGVLGQKLSS